METLAWIGVAQSLFAAIIILTKRQRSISDQLLSSWLFLLAVEYFTCAIDYIVYSKPLLSSSFLLFNPALYLYVKSLTRESFKLKWVQLLHLLPFVFFEITTYLISEKTILSAFFIIDSTHWFRMAFAAINIISWFLYNTQSIIIVHRHRKSLENEFSSIEKNKKLGWVLFIVIYYNVYCFIAVLIGITAIFYQTNPVLPHIYNYATLLILVYILGFYGLMQEIIYKKHEPEIREEETTAQPMLSESKTKEIKNRLLDYFNREKPYLDPEFNMATLSAKLLIPKHHLTQVLNAEIGKNFFRFVNEYRVEEVKKQIIIKKHYSMEAIGFECGFNSKSAFFSVFKNFTGLTPLQYKNTLKENT
ncbi:MAG: AraC family transcriptional regulator [Bacteroidales bacterium]|nr:AraC family transcriptional regulator [Bacteroidales bacterium]